MGGFNSSKKIVTIFGGNLGVAYIFCPSKRLGGNFLLLARQTGGGGGIWLVCVANVHAMVNWVCAMMVKVPSLHLHHCIMGLLWESLRGRTVHPLHTKRMCEVRNKLCGVTPM